MQQPTFEQFVASGDVYQIAEDQWRSATFLLGMPGTRLLETIIMPINQAFLVQGVLAYHDLVQPQGVQIFLQSQSNGRRYHHWSLVGISDQEFRLRETSVMFPGNEIIGLAITAPFEFPLCEIQVHLIGALAIKKPRR